MVSVLLLSFVTSIAGLQIANALTTASSSSSIDVSLLKVTKARESTITTKKDAEAEAAKQEEATKAAEATKATAAVKATEAKAAEVAAAAIPPRIAVKSPAGRALYNDAASKAAMPVEIASQPTAIWLGEWNANVQQYVQAVTVAASAQGTIPVFITYNIPNRDCGSHSAGGLAKSESYRAWTRAIAAGIGGREAIVIVEPDALAQIDCLSAADQARRYADLSDAVNVYSTTTGAFVYLDAGHGAWVGADDMAKRLEKANVGQARGFSLNISNFQTTQTNRAYGDKLSAKTGKTYVIDTSRNGQGPRGSEWCNPLGRGLGAKPAIVSNGNLDAYIWAKIPGESDGECNGGPSAGTFWAEYAQELIRNARY